MNKDDRGLGPARGCLIGLLASIPIWLLIIWLVF